MSAEIQRIRADLAKARERVAAMKAGEMGAAPPVETDEQKAEHSWHAAQTSKVAIPNGRLAWLNQLKARESDITRLEGELVGAMLPVWGASAVLERMEAPKPAPPPEPTPEPPARVMVINSDVTRDRLEALLSQCGDNFLPRSKLVELTK